MSEQFIDSSPTTQKSSFPEKRLALLVGVNDTPETGLEHLDAAEKDAQEMAEVLQAHCGFEIFSGQPLLGSNADSQSVRTAIYSFIENRQQDDFLLFYFSGHGILGKLGDRDKDDTVYLATSNFSWQHILIDPDHHPHISLKWLRQMLFDRCYAGKVLIILDCCFSCNIGEHGYDVEREDLIDRLDRFFNLNQTTAANPHGLHLTLSATTYDKVAYEILGRGPLAYYLIPALSGKADEAIDSKGRVNFLSLCQFLHDSLLDFPPSFSGGNAGQDCILAYHSKHPLPYFPYAHDPLFRPSKNAFSDLQTALYAEHARLGLVGMGGVGKSLLARELAISTQNYFTDGLFWAPATLDEHTINIVAQSNPLIHALAILAEKTRYLPPNEDLTYPNEEQRARHLCHFLAKLPHALLLLDNLEDPDLIQTTLSDLAGQDLQCSILYTSRSPFRPSTYTIHHVTPLNREQDLLYLLLHDVRPDVLNLPNTQPHHPELIAAHAICQRTGGLPLALILLRRQLEQHSWLTLTELDQELRDQGVLAIAQDEQHIKKSLRSTFTLSWQRIAQSAEHNLARQMFLLASYFPQAEPIPLWLLALACAQPEQLRLNSPLLNARKTLLNLSLIEDISRDTIQMHSLLRDFGQELTQQSSLQPILQDAAEQIISTFEQVQSLAERARKSDFWSCLTQIRTARTYVAALQPALAPRLQRIEHRLDRETFFLGTSGLWPDQIPGLFYQQMYNRLLEEEQPLPPPPPPGTRWLQQLARVGLEDDQIIRVYSGHSGGVTSVAFSPDGSKVLTGSEDTTTRLFDTATGKTLHILSGHSEVIDSVAYSPDGIHVLTGSRDHTARLWDVESGECIHILTGHRDWINEVIFSPDGKLIVTGSQDGTIHIRKNIDEYLCVIIGHTDWINGQDFLLRLSNTDLHHPHPLKLWEDDEGQQGDQEKTSDSNPFAVSCLAFSPDGTQIAVGFLNGHISLWSLTEQSLITHFSAHDRWIMSLAFSPDGSKILTASVDRTARLWDLQTLTCLKQLKEHTGPVGDVAFSFDGLYMFTSSWDRTIRIWSTRSGALLHSFPDVIGIIGKIAISPRAFTIAVASSNGNGYLLEISQEQLAQMDMDIIDDIEDEDEDDIPFYIRDIRVHRRSHLTGVTFSANSSSLLVGYCDSTATVWNVTTGKMEAELLDNWNEVLAVAISNDQLKALIATNTYLINIWNLQNEDCIHHLKGHTGHIYSVAFSPDGRHILSGSADTTARLWDATSGKTIKVLTGHVHTIMSVAFSPNGKQLLTGSRDSTARLWTKRGREWIPTVLKGHQKEVLSVAFSRDGSKAFTGSEDTFLRMWDTTTGNLLHAFDGRLGSISRLACSPDNTHILAGDMFNQIRVWNIRDNSPQPLVGAYSTITRLVALHWQDHQHILLADDIGPDKCPRIYKLRMVED